MEYNKLVRDKIPERIKQGGKKPITHIANDGEYWEKLKEKLQEEVSEFIEDSTEEELTDILEVIENICYFKNINKAKLEKLRKIRQEKAKLEKALKIKLSFSGRDIYIGSAEGNAMDEYVTCQIIEAIELGFTLHQALPLKDEE